MSSKSDWRSELEQVREKLRDPFKMRMAVAGVTVAVMCFAISDPIQGRMRRSKLGLNEMKTTVRTAEEVMLLRDKFAEVEGRIMTGKGNDVVVSHLIDVVRSEQVELMRIDAQAPDRLGPLHSVQVNLDVNGSFAALMALLHRIESDRYLIRVETVSLNPPELGSSKPTMNLNLRLVKDES